MIHCAFILHNICILTKDEAESNDDSVDDVRTESIDKVRDFDTEGMNGKEIRDRLCQLV